ncbi:MAG: hypothetical protein HY801_02310 [Candidatus Lindowbacteria bacterium]|nr:hypothetical protein [Candidatus Lindowbacteria bacterium]
MLIRGLTCNAPRRAVLVAIIVLAEAVCFTALVSRESYAENRLYHLRVTLRSGERYETISTLDPVNYCSVNGGSVVFLRDYSLIYSAEMKVKVLRTWLDRSNDLGANWRRMLEAHNMLSNHNHKPLPRVPPLTLAAMRRPE